MNSYRIAQSDNKAASLLGALAAVAFLSACGGGGGDSGPPLPLAPAPASTIITDGNYVDVAGLTIISTQRLAFLQDVIDEAFEAVLFTADTPGTYACDFGGTLTYARSGSSYTFSVSNCDADVAGERVLFPSGTMQIANATVQTTSAGSGIVGYFLTGGTVTWTNLATLASAVVTTYSGSVEVSATVTSSTTAAGQASNGTLAVQRLGRTDAYSGVNVTGVATLFAGNTITGGSLTLASPRGPGALSLAFGSAATTASASDGSQSILSTSNGTDYSLQFAVAGAVQASTSGSINSGVLAEAIAAALQ